MKNRTLAAGLILAAAASSALADDIPEQSFKVIGTWGNASMYNDYELPLWRDTIPQASGGKISTDMQAITDLGLAGSETIKLLSTGAYDAGFALYSYIVSGDPVFEGFDLALVAQSAEEQQKLVAAYSPVVEKAMSDVHSVKLMTNYPFPLPVIACRDEFKSLADLKGRKVRVFATTQADMIEGLGAVGVSIPLAEVPTSLQRGVVDCALASGIAMYNSKWFDVVHYLYEMPVGGAMGFLGMTQAKWDSLDQPTKSLLDEQSKLFSDKAWAATRLDEQQGIACLTGERLGGPECQHGEAAKMTLVKTSPEDAELRIKILNEFVLKRYAERCGAECATEWSKSAGAAIGVAMPE